MGSPISNNLSDIVMQDLETEILNKLDFQIFAYFRYVGDTFLIIAKDQIDKTVAIFNSLHKRLQFIHKSEKNITINFLNINIIISDNGSISTNWFRK